VSEPSPRLPLLSIYLTHTLHYHRHIVQVHAFPETANGKLDRKALRDPVESDLCDHIPSETGEGTLDADDDDEEEEKNACSDSRMERGKDHLKDNKSVRAEMSSDARGDSRLAVLALASHICDIVEKVSDLCCAIWCGVMCCVVWCCV
jgi:hypothetical protein